MASFYFQYKAFMLTYRTHVNKDEYERWLKEKIKVDFEFIRIAHETGHEETPYEHSHVVVKLKKRFMTLNERFFDFEGIHPHITGIDLRKKNAWENRVQYLAKEDPANADLKKIECLADRIWNYDNLQECLRKEVTVSGETMGLIQLYNARPSPKIEIDIDLYPWQEELHQIVKPENLPDGRSVHWWWERKGGAGKTALAKWLMNKYPNYYYLVNSVGNFRDFATIIRNAFSSGWNGHCLIINLTRAHEHHKGLYACMESICDGIITSTKYSGGTELWNGSHVVVFANWEPDKTKMSMDRWKIHSIGDNLTLKELSPIAIPSGGTEVMNII